MFQLLLIIDKGAVIKVIKNGNGELTFPLQAEKNFLLIFAEKNEEDQEKRSLQVTLTMLT